MRKKVYFAIISLDFWNVCSQEEGDRTVAVRSTNKDEAIERNHLMFYLVGLMVVQEGVSRLS